MARPQSALQDLSTGSSFQIHLQSVDFSFFGMEGSCNCGAVTVSIDDPELFSRPRGHICHCTFCRKSSGSGTMSPLQPLRAPFVRHCHITVLMMQCSIDDTSLHSIISSRDQRRRQPFCLSKHQNVEWDFSILLLLQDLRNVCSSVYLDASFVVLRLTSHCQPYQECDSIVWRLHRR